MRSSADRAFTAHSQPEHARDQARRWCAAKRVPSDLAVMSGAVKASARRKRQQDRGSSDYYYIHLVAWENAVAIIRRAANHFPHPASGALFDAAFRRIESGRADEETIHRDDLNDLITDILENPDALLD